MKELTLEEIQQGSFQVLLKFREICEKNNFEYFLAYGTLIGAVRHKGFIPWDDDIDVWMPRTDYEKFVQYCIDNTSNLVPFTLKHYKTCKEYIYPIARLVDTRYKIDYGNTKDYGLGLFIDIYPLDGVNVASKKLFRQQTKYIRKISVFGTSKYIKSKSRVKNIFKKIYWCFNKRLCANEKLNYLIAHWDSIAQRINYNDSKNVACVVWEKGVFAKKYFESSVELCFEGEKFKVPIGYDNLLTEIYGDYMTLPPQEDRIAHHYYSAYKVI